ncbi:asparagine synthase (glutamine-hydrolyzing) [Peristeroidobacter agariperforans]|uniref:asparagine synthase (glutamine-hydrolyzing) n=1 Tax=Peristeroidobacter agariperforans TaxID=268404 RepID=UPI00101C00E4|nr:asparagine synthase (glutamine-hydrolyzing) [Peristeroidobacter agariperforans]
MCGIAGVLRASGFRNEAELAALRQMAARIAHRGPDDAGVWTDPDAGIGLAHRRLSILDLSALGHQPMVSASGRYVISYNGEIYNFGELRAELIALGQSFKGHSDTEVMLGAIDAWGPESAIRRATGMFAIALWDRKERALTLARDRLGEKPVYYAVCGNVLLFGSELKALRAHPAWRGQIDRRGLALLLKHNYIPAPHTIYDTARKLAPGCMLKVTLSGERLSLHESFYWDAKSAVAEAVSHRLLTAEEAIDETERAIRLAVEKQLVADVPVGAFLSGGIDSSLIVANMQKCSALPTRTFTIGFEEEQFNEAPFAREIATHLGTQHTELILTPRDILQTVPRITEIYDEPFADSSQLPTFLVSQLARQSVTVSLSGDGGDELFAGYDRFSHALARWKSVQAMPRSVRAAAAGAIDSLSEESLDAILQGLATVVPSWRKKRALPSRLRTNARFWRARSVDDIFEELISYWSSPPVNGIAADWPQRVVTPAGLDDMQRMMFTDMCRYLPDDILVKVDRAAMAVSLETRVPLLDPKVVETAWRIPTAIHRRDGRGKWVLRQLLARHVPEALFDRPKRGFAVPIPQWLRTDLRDWAEDLLDTKAIAAGGYFDPSIIEKRWREHLRGDMDWSFHLWGVLMFQAWQRTQESDASEFADAPRVASAG